MEEAYQTVHPDTLRIWRPMKEVKFYTSRLYGKLELNIEREGSTFIGQGLLVLPNDVVRTHRYHWDDKKELQDFLAMGLVFNGPGVEGFGRQVFLPIHSNPHAQLTRFLEVYNLPKAYFDAHGRNVNGRLIANLDGLTLKTIRRTGSNDNNDAYRACVGEMVGYIELLRKSNSIDCLVANRPHSLDVRNVIEILKKRGHISSYEVEFMDRDVLTIKAGRPMRYRANVTVDGSEYHSAWCFTKAAAKSLAIRRFFYCQKSKNPELYAIANELAKQNIGKKPKRVKQLLSVA